MRRTDTSKRHGSTYQSLPFDERSIPFVLRKMKNRDHALSRVYKPSPSYVQSVAVILQATAPDGTSRFFFVVGKHERNDLVRERPQMATWGAKTT